MRTATVWCRVKWCKSVSLSVRLCPRILKFFNAQDISGRPLQGLYIKDFLGWLVGVDTRRTEAKLFKSSHVCRFQPFERRKYNPTVDWLTPSSCLPPKFNSTLNSKFNSKFNVNLFRNMPPWLSIHSLENFNKQHLCLKWLVPFCLNSEWVVCNDAIVCRAPQYCSHILDCIKHDKMHDQCLWSWGRESRLFVFNCGSLCILASFLSSRFFLPWVRALGNDSFIFFGIFRHRWFS